MISPMRSRLARWSTTLTVKAKPSSRTMAAAACLCLTERTPAIRSATSGSESWKDIWMCSSATSLSRSTRARVKPTPEGIPEERPTARQAELQDAERPGLRKDPLPVVGGEFALRADQIQRIGAVGAVQRATMGQLRQQRGWDFSRHEST